VKSDLSRLRNELLEEI
jgi:hypothetical protein